MPAFNLDAKSLELFIDQLHFILRGISLLCTCKVHGIEPFVWLKDMPYLIADRPVNRVAELPPHRYKK